MKITNIVLSILILLLSAVAAVFSYFLFEKRSQFVAGWGQMAASIAKTSQALDKGSGTKDSAKLTASALAHENYSQLSQLLPVLPTQAERIITERDRLARTLLSVNNIVGKQRSDINLENLCSIDNYAKSSDAVLSGVRSVIQVRDRNYTALSNMMKRDFGVTIDRKKLLDGSSDVFKDAENKVRAYQARMRVYDNFIIKLGRSLSVRVSAKPEENIKAIENGISVAQKRYQEKERECRTLKSAKAGLERDVKRMQGVVTQQKKAIAFRDSQITQFQRALGLAESSSTAHWTAGSPEARSAFSGKVISVNTKFGYIAIDAGKYSVVEQHIGNSVFEINPCIEPGLAMLVTRRNGDKDDFIARVQVAQVSENTCVANIPVDAKEIRVGDNVTLVVEKAEPAASAQKNAKR